MSLEELLDAYTQENDLTPDVEAFPSLLGIFCDECKIIFSGDFIVHSGMGRDERLGVIRKHMTEVFGWTCDEDGDVCKNCQPGANPKVVYAPWTPREVEDLQNYQRHPGYHPYTCGRDHDGHRTLIPTGCGWKCPEINCDYTQLWAQRAMLHITKSACPLHGTACEADDHIEPPTVNGEVV